VVTRRGFALVEVVVALLVFTVGALGASALTIHAASLATRAEQAERAGRRAAALFAILEGSAAVGQGTVHDRVATYSWTAGGDSVRTIAVVAITRAARDTIRMQASWPPVPPLLRAAP
jgi:prepilin-type N-terminal cleavage/methylation domain-containing protein